MRKHILSYSGGKDSTAMYLLALERRDKRPNFDFDVVFADTQNEHEHVYDFIAELPAKTSGPPIRTVTADFTEWFERRRKFVVEKWPEDLQARALEVLHPSGSVFLDLAILKGRFGSSQSRFCTEHLKVKVVADQIYMPIWEQGDQVISWQGIRREESHARSFLPMFSWNQWEDYKALAFRPLIEWKLQDVWDMHKRHGIARNPLYDHGFGRVGCFPCVLANKNEVRLFGDSFQEHVDRLDAWEKIVSSAAKRGCATFFSVTKDPKIAKRINAAKKVDPKNPDLSWITQEEHGISNIVEWSHTSRGGRQFDIDFMDDVMTPCNAWGACE